MATVIDSLIVTLGLDPTNFTAGQKAAAEAIKKTRDETAYTAAEMERRGKQAGQFFAQIKNEALSLISVLVGGRAFKDFAVETVNSLSKIGQAAKNLGVSVPELEALAMAIDRNGGNAEAAKASFQGLADAMQKIKTGRPNAELSQWLAFIHADPTKDSALTVFQKFSEFAEKNRNQPMLVRQVGQGIGFDETAINEAQKGWSTVRKEIEESYKIGVPTQKLAEDLKKIQEALITVQQAATNAGRAFMSDAAPGITAFLHGVTNFIEKEPGAVQLIGELGITLIALNAIRFTALISGLGAVNGALLPLMATAVAVAGAIDIIKHPFGNIDPNESKELALLRSQGKEAEELQGSGFHDPVTGRPIPKSEINPQTHLPYAPGERESMGGGSAPGGGAFTGDRSATMETARQYFLGKGLSENAVAGILANVGAESGFDPTNVGDNGSSYGLFQHHDTGPGQGRMSELFAFAGTKTPTSQQQLDFMWHELTTKPEYAGVLEQLRNGSITPEQAAYYWTTGIEKPANSVAAGMTRAGKARSFLSGSSAALPNIPPGAPPLALPGVPIPTLPNIPPPVVPGFNGMLGANQPANNNTRVEIGQITVNTKATDAKGIARDMALATRDALVTQANRGLS